MRKYLHILISLSLFLKQVFPEEYTFLIFLINMKKCCKFIILTEWQTFLFETNNFDTQIILNPPPNVKLLSLVDLDNGGDVCFLVYFDTLGGDLDLDRFDTL
jgi:hypothetical protein